jgi:hypothetical protein
MGEKGMDLYSADKWMAFIAFSRWIVSDVKELILEVFEIADANAPRFCRLLMPGLKPGPTSETKADALRNQLRSLCPFDAHGFFPEAQDGALAQVVERRSLAGKLFPVDADGVFGDLAVGFSG